MQPDLPRPVQLTAPQWYVVSEAVITNPCRKTISFDPKKFDENGVCLLYTSPSPRDQRGSRMPSSA